VIALIKNIDGSVQIMNTSNDPTAEIAKMAPALQTQIASWREIQADGVPIDRTFRGAWCDVTAAPVVDIDMPKARNIHRDRLRKLRAPLLAALDIEMSKAYKNPAAQDTIEAKRQALRDVTADPSIEAAKTPEELKAAIPAILSP
jgi:hypothetical protein